jgi:trimeric autotransporter adhesin
MNVRFEMQRLLPVIVVATLAFGCGSTTSAPTVSPSPIISAIWVSATGNGKVNQLQMMASGRYEQGSGTNVTNLSTWQTSDPTVATVTANGVLTVVSNGKVTITASYQGLSGSLTPQLPLDD